MAYKDPLDPRNREARLRHYRANKDQYRRRNAEKKARNRAFIKKVKAVPCLDCGVRYPSYVMDFDHRQGVEKDMNISRMVSGWGTRRLEAEIAKCDVVCANCHRERTHQRREQSQHG
jgi:hypothetical protein